MARIVNCVASVSVLNVCDQGNFCYKEMEDIFLVSSSHRQSSLIGHVDKVNISEYRLEYYPWILSSASPLLVPGWVHMLQHQ